jgi:type VI protein secretion system component Hcp
MASDSKYYLRFSEYMGGRSNYEPAKGWIDVRSYSVQPEARAPGSGGGKTPKSGEVSVAIAVTDASTPKLIMAYTAGIKFDFAEVSMVSKALTRRVTYFDVMVAGVSAAFDESGPCHAVQLTYADSKAVTDSPPPAAAGK